MALGKQTSFTRPTRLVIERGSTIWVWREREGSFFDTKAALVGSRYVMGEQLLHDKGISVDANRANWSTTFLERVALSYFQERHRIEEKEREKDKKIRMIHENERERNKIDRRM